MRNFEWGQLGDKSRPYSERLVNNDPEMSGLSSIYLGEINGGTARRVDAGF